VEQRFSLYLNGHGQSVWPIEAKKWAKQLVEIVVPVFNRDSVTGRSRHYVCSLQPSGRSGTNHSPVLTYSTLFFRRAKANHLPIPNTVLEISSTLSCVFEAECTIWYYIKFVFTIVDHIESIIHFSSLYIVKKDKVITLQARCGPEGG